MRRRKNPHSPNFISEISKIRGTQIVICSGSMMVWSYQKNMEEVGEIIKKYGYVTIRIFPDPMNRKAVFEIKLK